MTEGIPLKDIAGAVVENKICDFHKENSDAFLCLIERHNECDACKMNYSYNLCIGLQAEVRLTLDSDKLAEILSLHIVGKKELQYPLADAIISNLSSLIVVVKEKKG